MPLEPRLVPDFSRFGDHGGRVHMRSHYFVQYFAQLFTERSSLPYFFLPNLKPRLNNLKPKLNLTYNLNPGCMNSALMVPEPAKIGDLSVLETLHNKHRNSTVEEGYEVLVKCGVKKKKAKSRETCLGINITYKKFPDFP